MFQIIKSLNYWKDRKGYKPEAIVIHISEGNRKSVINWLLTPASQVSYHYLICKNGDIIQFVEEKNTAWHCGYIKNPKWSLLKKGVNPNYYTIGIAFEGFDDEQLTLPQLLIGAWLLSKISAARGIYLDLEHVIPHNWINSSKICPGAGISLDCLLWIAQRLKDK